MFCYMAGEEGDALPAQTPFVRQFFVDSGRQAFQQRQS
jgi:hypothetical protein